MATGLFKNRIGNTLAASFRSADPSLPCVYLLILGVPAPHTPIGLPTGLKSLPFSIPNPKPPSIHTQKPISTLARIWLGKSGDPP